MIGDVLKALRQMGDKRFRGVLWRGIGLTLALLIAVYVGFFWLVGWLLPDTIALPWVGEIGWVDNLASWASVLLMLALSVFLMVPVASAFTGFFLDDVTDAVEERFYPNLARAPSLGLGQGLRDAAGFFVVVVAANLVALLIYLGFPPAAPFLFYALNGYLLGREYFGLIATRRLGREGARAMRRRHGARIWLTGALMAVPLTVPILNLTVPILGAATFTHLFHRLARRPSG